MSAALWRGRPALCEPAGGNGSARCSAGIAVDANGRSTIISLSAFATQRGVGSLLVRVDKDLPLEEAALFGCAVLTGVGAAVNTAAIEPGQSVAVVGLGGVGLAALMGAKAAGAARIVAVDLSADKLALAAELGATDCLNGADGDGVAALTAHRRPLELAVGDPGARAGGRFDPARRHHGHRGLPRRARRPLSSSAGREERS